MELSCIRHAAHMVALAQTEQFLNLNMGKHRKVSFFLKIYTYKIIIIYIYTKGSKHASFIHISLNQNKDNQQTQVVLCETKPTEGFCLSVLMVTAIFILHIKFILSSFTYFV